MAKEIIMNIDFNSTANALEQHGKTFLKRKAEFRFSWGKEVNTTLDIIKRGSIFANPDDINESTYAVTDESKELSKWMCDTKGKGLALIGTSGRGKTLFLHGILPHLLIASNKVPYCIKSSDLDNSNYGKILLIDEVGREDLVFDKQRGKIDRFNEYVDYCADKNRPLFFTTNLSAGQFVDRYGEHILNRVQSICKVVVYNGKSMW